MAAQAQEQNTQVSSVNKLVSGTNIGTGKSGIVAQQDTLQTNVH